MSNTILNYPNGVYTLNIDSSVKKIDLVPATSKKAQYYNHCTWKDSNGDVLVEWQIQLSKITILQNPKDIIQKGHVDAKITSNINEYKGSTLTFKHKTTENSTQQASLLKGTDLVAEPLEIIHLSAEDKYDTNFLDFTMTILYR